MNLISCPFCRHEFNTQRAPGTQVFCPQCLKYFAVPAAASVVSASPASALPMAIDLPSAITARPGILEAPPSRVKQSKRAKSRPVLNVARESERPSRLPWILAGAGLCVVALAVGILIAAMRRHADDAPPAEAPLAAVPSAVSLAPNARKMGDASKPDAPAAPHPFVKPPVPVVEVPVRPVADQPPPAFDIPPIKREPMLGKGPPIAGLDQKKIDDAIARGVQYLKKSHVETAVVDKVGRHRLGYAALTGLTLIECKVPAADADVQKLSRAVRADAVGETRTYELALSILFLDRLGESRDRTLIQNMALRLIAGQNLAGGWTYENKLLSPADSKTLLTFLNQFRRDLPADTMIGAKTDPLNPAMKDLKPLNPLEGSTPLPTAIRKDAVPAVSGIAAETNPAKPASDAKIATPLDISPKPVALPAATTDPKTTETKASSPALKPKALRVESLPASLQQIPSVSNDFSPKTKVKTKGAKGVFVKGGPGGDNSNTQFAMLGLWAARRHGVGSERALLLADKRFATSQNDDGGWGYHLTMPTRHTMNCVGLMGLAMGHGAGLSANPNLDPKNAKNAPPADPQIQKGLQSLGRFIGTPAVNPASTSMENLYLLWSIERVAMLYDLKTIGGKDWYGWGAQMLVHHQHGDGSWTSRQFAGNSPTVDTCFALLFLKRSNLVKDLSDDLRLYVGITDPEASTSPR